jgi:hypothetical protein
VNGKALVVEGGGSGRILWSMEVPGKETAANAVAEDGKFLVVDADGTLKVLDTKTGKIVRQEQRTLSGATMVNDAPSVGSPRAFSRSSARVVASSEDIELAEINLQEKQLELESAREDAAASNDSKSQRKVKLAELAVRRAEIELARVKGGGSVQRR